MRGLRTLMLILLAAVSAVGGPLRAPSAQAAAPPACHMMAEMEGAMAAPHNAPAHKPKPDLMAMACCAGCLPAVARDIASGLGPGAGVRIVFAPVHQIANGLSPAPEQGPPRPFA